ncbi:quinol monooxygenase YgiN [Mucilaginibacter oryzae]|uniref:Quinol monooxygenase YgiN n=1 Tax=Mucilaginibacter oryzae TaxID=468058 RepID=A0A316GVY1_9SPHI|nr:putative quinol monooxygenase [Mucilaginibacter oryzae]PWK66337.1 quinol monooxygenase YgiN [Mucilaginibacter oryzae]
MKIYLTALLKCKPGYAAQIKPILEQLVANSVQEAACLQYELYQDNDNENQFIFHETWQDAAGLEQHTQQPHYLQFGKQAGEMLDGGVTVYKTQRVA